MSTVKSIYLQHLNGTTPNATMDTNGNFTVGGTVSGASSNMFRNRIINGDMRIDQRNAGAAVTPSDNAYTLDRWSQRSSGSGAYTVQRDTTVPTGQGFTYSVKATVTTADSSIDVGDIYSFLYKVEGYNTSDFMWGTSAAKAVTLSFWARSSQTGTYSIGFLNIDANRGYAANYTISSANTWEYKTITINGDTTGDWWTDNRASIQISFCLACGTNRTEPAGSWTSANVQGADGTFNWMANNGATFYLTGVQLEVGTAATPFEFRSYGHELALCQRYYQKSYDLNLVPGATTGNYYGGSVMVVAHAAATVRLYAAFRVSMRATPTITLYNPYSGTSGQLSENSSTTNIAASTPIPSTEGFYAGSSSSVVSGRSYEFHYTAAIEL